MADEGRDSARSMKELGAAVDESLDLVRQLTAFYVHVVDAHGPMPPCCPRIDLDLIQVREGPGRG